MSCATQEKLQCEALLKYLDGATYRNFISVGKCPDFCFIPSGTRCTDAKQYKFSSGLLTSKVACKASSSIGKDSGSDTGAGGDSGTGADGGSDTAPTPTPCECSNHTEKDHLGRLKLYPLQQSRPGPRCHLSLKHL